MSKTITKHLNKVFFGDVLELLKKIPDKSVDAIYSDPDYNVGIKYGSESYTVSFDEYINWYITLSKESLSTRKDSLLNVIY